MIFSWQIKQWQSLWRAKCDGRLPHALLLSGPKGVGKTRFTEIFIQALFCNRQENLPEGTQLFCGTCHACHLIASGVHPSVKWLVPEKEGQAIKIDPIREMVDFVNQSSLQGDYCVVIIRPADAMNSNAANALLKTLEEPPFGAIIILISDQSNRLPATIRSRCQKIHFPIPQRHLALHFLQTELVSMKLNEKMLDPELLLNLAKGAPLAAIELMKGNELSLREQLFKLFYELSLHQREPIEAAASLQSIELITFVELSLQWIMDLLRIHLIDASILPMNKDYVTELMQITQRTQSKKVMRYLAYLNQLHMQLLANANLNKQLIIECSLIRWMECVA